MSIDNVWETRDVSTLDKLSDLPIISTKMGFSFPILDLIMGLEEQGLLRNDDQTT